MKPCDSDLVWKVAYEPRPLLYAPIESVMEALARSPHVGLYNKGRAPETEVPDSLGRAPCTWADVDYGPESD